MVKPREHRIPTMFSEDELTAIDDWRFTNRIATRADAVRRLIQIGLFSSRTVPDLWSVVRSFTDEELLALLELGDPNTTQERRAAILGVMTDHPDRARLVLGALSLKLAVESFKEGKTFDESVAVSTKHQSQLGKELAYALGQAVEDTE